MKTLVSFVPDLYTEYEGKLGNQTFQLAPGFSSVLWYAQWQDAAGETNRVLRSRAIEHICDIWRESGFDLRFLEWKVTNTDIVHGYNPFIRPNEIQLWGKERSNVYFALDSSTGYIKIGYSRQYQKRIQALSGQYKADITVLGLLEGGELEEKYVHDELRQYRVAGEWFSDCEDIREFIEQYCYNPSRLGQ